jgi:hypothetical protein
MAFYRGQCSDICGTIKRPSVELLSQWIMVRAMDLSRNDSQMEDVKEVGSVGSENGTVRSE